MTDLPRFAVSLSAGSRPGRPYAVVDRHADGGKRVRSWHRSFPLAMRTVKRLNDEAGYERSR
jgi:hypothetical protein